MDQIWTRRPAADADLARVPPGHAMRQRAAEIHADLERRRGLTGRHPEPFGEELGWLQAAQGEEYIASLLHPLRTAGWLALHGVVVSDAGATIDHLLIGPGGVYCIDTKARPGSTVTVDSHAVAVDGRTTGYLWDVTRLATRASEVLSLATGLTIAVVPTLAFVIGPQGSLHLRGRPRAVAIVSERDLPAAFAQRPRVLGDGDVALVFEHARVGRTWFPPDRPQQPDQPHSHGVQPATDQ
jgi:hypothetical protein